MKQVYEAPRMQIDVFLEKEIVCTSGLYNPSEEGTPEEQPW